MAKVYHISVSDLRKLKHDALESPHKEQVLEDLAAFGIDEAFVKDMHEDDFDAIAGITERTAERIGTSTPPLPKSINWIALIGLLLGSIVVMMLLLDLARPESVRQIKEPAVDDKVEKNNSNQDRGMNEMEAPASDKEETDLPTSNKKVDAGDENEEVAGTKESKTDEITDTGDKNEDDTAVQNSQEEESDDHESGKDKELTTQPKTKKKNKTNTTTPDPKSTKTYISVASAKIVMQEAVGRSKYTPSDVPKFDGGRVGLERYIKQKVGQIPHEKVDFGYRSVMVSFEVNSKGKVENVELMTGLTPELDKQTLDIIQNMPDWNPGKRVKMRYQLAVKYK